MKKILKTLGIISLLTTPVTSAILFDGTNIVQNKENILNNSNEIKELETYSTTVPVSIDDSVVTSPAGTQAKESKGEVWTWVSNSTWLSDFQDSNSVIVKGRFKYGTYRDGEEEKSIELNIESIGLNERTWENDKTVESWYGWAHQTSRIKLTVEVVNYPSIGIISIKVSYYIYARTAGAIHRCRTEIEVDRLKFVTE